MRISHSDPVQSSTSRADRSQLLLLICRQRVEVFMEARFCGCLPEEFEKVCLGLVVALAVRERGVLGECHELCGAVESVIARHSVVAPRYTWGLFTLLGRPQSQVKHVRLVFPVIVIAAFFGQLPRCRRLECLHVPAGRKELPYQHLDDFERRGDDGELIGV